MPPLPPPTLVLFALDLLGTFVFALSGALKGVRHELDVLGIVVLAVLTGVGGGLIRDMLLGATPPVAFEDERYFLVCLAGAAIGLVAAPTITGKRWGHLLIADAIGLGLFAAMGAGKAVAFGLGPLGVVMMGALTAVGGGVVRDVLVGERPAILYKGFYATAALVGAALLLGLRALDLPEIAQLSGAAVTASALRFYAMARNVQLPRARAPEGRMR